MDGWNLNGEASRSRWPRFRRSLFPPQADKLAPRTCDTPIPWNPVAVFEW
jgi:hypothetical protein